ncbi:MAG: hypothetical protein IPP54_08320 [Anaerolineales bacterium]|nr:hypothetical protein [Anaerolineales bacterium]
MTHEDWIYSVSFSPDGKYAASGGEDMTARVWEVANGNKIAYLVHDGSVNSLAFSRMENIWSLGAATKLPM